MENKGLKSIGSYAELKKQNEIPRMVMWYNTFDRFDYMTAPEWTEYFKKSEEKIFEIVLE